MYFWKRTLARLDYINKSGYFGLPTSLHEHGKDPHASPSIVRAHVEVALDFRGVHLENVHSNLRGPRVVFTG